MSDYKDYVAAALAGATVPVSKFEPTSMVHGKYSAIREALKTAAAQNAPAFEAMKGTGQADARDELAKALGISAFFKSLAAGGTDRGNNSSGHRLRLL